MNWDQAQGQWKQLEAQLKSKWAKLTDDDMKNVGAKKDMLVAKIQERYGIMKEDAERDVDEWLRKLSARLDSADKKGPGAVGGPPTEPSRRHM
jgi:uncharacterized protein YjbJ (UPF0337 family)